MTVPPGPRGREVLGFFGAGSFSGTVDFLEQTARRFGPISSFRILHKRIYLVDDADLIRDILVTQQHKFERDSGAKLLRELVGDALITREEPLHRERRRLLQPAFHRDQIASYARIIVTEAERFAHERRVHEPVDIRAEMRRLTLAIAGESLFGTHFRESASDVASVLQSVGKRSRWLAPALPLIEPLVNSYRQCLPRGPSLFFQKERKQLDQIITPVLRRGCSSGGKDMLSLLLNGACASNESLSPLDVQNEIVTFILAGHETTASALTATWVLLSKHPDVAARLQSEVDTVLGDRRPAFDDAGALPYTNLVFQEAMRLYPPALAFARRTKEAVELAGYKIPRGTSVFLSPYATHRNPKYFVRPEEFRPERWEADSIPPRLAYFPFGAGAKMCIGEPFAKLEGVLILAVLSRHWKFESMDNEPLRVGTGLLLNPGRSILMKPVAREAMSNGLPDKSGYKPSNCRARMESACRLGE